MKPGITILITDDQPLTRAGLRAVLERAPDMIIIGEARDGDEAQRLVAELHPDVLLLDLKMPGLLAAELEKWVRVNYPETATLVLTAHDRDFYLAEMMAAGVSGYIDKSERAENLVAAIRRAVSGEFLFTNEQFKRAHHWNETEGKKWQSLTEREREISRLLVNGLDDAALAQTLKITPRTASYHVTNLLKKLCVSSRQEVVTWLLKHIPDITDDLLKVRS